ncbi:3371_t:CDS:2, partial [Scutellospora calospora]
MSTQLSRIVKLLTEEPLDAICSESVVYLAMVDNTLGEYEDVRELADRAVKKALEGISNSDRRDRVSMILPQKSDIVGFAIPEMSRVSASPQLCVAVITITMMHYWRLASDYAHAQMENGYKSVKGLNAIMALNMEKEPAQDHEREEIERNLNFLKEKLDHPSTDADGPLYDSLKKKIDTLDPKDLTWKDPEANMILSDKSKLVESLEKRQKKTFTKPRENMKCDLPESILFKCDEFVENFDRTIVSGNSNNIFHNKTWKENERDLGKRTGRILDVLSEIWCNPAFATSMSRSEQSEGTYVADVVMPLLRATLEDFPDGNLCLSTAERQSLASKARRNPRIGKKPDVMVLVKHEQKVDELVYVECSRVVCTNTKRDDDAVKLWREALDGISYVGTSCRPASNQFGIVGIQVAREVVHLNVLMLDGAGIPRYFHLDQAEIPLTTDTPWRVKPLIRLLLTLRNTLIVNKSLLKRALEQADTNPPRNARPSPAVSSPTREEQARTRK